MKLTAPPEQVLCDHPCQHVVIVPSFCKIFLNYSKYISPIWMGFRLALNHAHFSWFSFFFCHGCRPWGPKSFPIIFLLFQQHHIKCVPFDNSLYFIAAEANWPRASNTLSALERTAAKSRRREVPALSSLSLQYFSFGNPSHISNSPCTDFHHIQ